MSNLNNENTRPDMAAIKLAFRDCAKMPVAAATFMLHGPGSKTQVKIPQFLHVLGLKTVEILNGEDDLPQVPPTFDEPELTNLQVLTFCMADTSLIRQLSGDIRQGFINAKHALIKIGRYFEERGAYAADMHEVMDAKGEELFLYQMKRLRQDSTYIREMFEDTGNLCREAYRPDGAIDFTRAAQNLKNFIEEIKGRMPPELENIVNLREYYGMNTEYCEQICRSINETLTAIDMMFDKLGWPRDAPEIPINGETYFDLNRQGLS